MISVALLDTSFDHRGGLSNFPIKHPCHSSDILVANGSDKNSSYSFSHAFMETSIQALCFAVISFTETHSASRGQYQKMEAFSLPSGFSSPSFGWCCLDFLSRSFHTL